jgi:hypothetical protein
MAPWRPWLMLAASLVQANVAHAHSGGLNAEGCHNNRKTGDYHCHRKAAQRAAEPGPRAKPQRRAGSTCGDKRTCKQMDSCAEARHYLTECGIGRLDGDGDGVPCESLCGR